MTIVMTILSKLLLGIGVLMVAAYLGACAYLWSRQTRFIFFPSSAIENTPISRGLQYEDIWLPVQVENGKVEHLNAWWIPATTANAGTLLFLHGNGANNGANLGYAERFHRMGLNVLLVDYRGFGRSEGDFPTEATVYQDTETVWNYLVQEKNINPQQIFLYGHSLGGAIAIELAFRHPKVGGLIIEGSFTSMRDMVDFRYKLFNLFPVDILLNQKFDSINKLPKIKKPILFIHGGADNLVPPNMSKELFLAAHEPKELYIVPGAGHNDVLTLGGDHYLETVYQFIQAAYTYQK